MDAIQRKINRLKRQLKKDPRNLILAKEVYLLCYLEGNMAVSCKNILANANVTEEKLLMTRRPFKKKAVNTKPSLAQKSTGLDFKLQESLALLGSIQELVKSTQA